MQGRAVEEAVVPYVLREHSSPVHRTSVAQVAGELARTGEDYAWEMRAKRVIQVRRLVQVCVRVAASASFRAELLEPAQGCPQTQTVHLEEEVGMQRVEEEPVG